MKRKSVPRLPGPGPRPFPLFLIPKMGGVCHSIDAALMTLLSLCGEGVAHKKACLIGVKEEQELSQVSINAIDLPAAADPFHALPPPSYMCTQRVLCNVPVLVLDFTQKMPGTQSTCEPRGWI